MREVDVKKLTEAVKNMCMTANFELGDDMTKAFAQGKKNEESEACRNIFSLLEENARIAREDRISICQDTGLGVIFVEVGQEVRFVGGDYEAALHEGVRQGYAEGFLRKSTCHPFTRKNVGDNTPAIIHTRIVPGDKVKIIVAPKGGGSENMSRVMMLTPASGRKGVVDFVVQRVKESGANPCPPIVVGIGIGGTFEKAALLAKEALLRPVGTPSADAELADLEKELLSRINDLGIGPQGFGGRMTCLGVHVNMMPCHIASLPLAVNIQCHANRHKEAVV